MTELRNIEREITVGLQKMQRDLGIRKPRGAVIAEWTMIGCIAAAAVFVFVVKAKAQQPTSDQLFNPGRVYCQNAKQHLVSIIKNPQFRQPREIIGEEARYWSHEVFGFVPGVDHAIIIPQSNGGAILVPCILGPNGPMWGGDQANRVAIDMKFRRDLEQPATQLSEQQDEQPKKKRRAKQ